MSTSSSDSAFACNLQAIPQEFRPQHQASAGRLFQSVQEVRELPTGYALRLPNETELLQSVVTFLSYERLCCPFFRFVLEIEPEQGPIWLQITGEEDVKPFLQLEGMIPPMSALISSTSPARHP